MGRIASTTMPAVTVPTDGGLLLDPATDLWADWGLLGVPDPDRATTSPQGLLFRDFIRSAFPTFQIHRLSELLIDLLQQVADGQLTGVAGDGTEQLRVPAHPVGGEQAGDQLTLPGSRRTADDQARQLPVGHLLQQIDQQL